MRGYVPGFTKKDWKRTFPSRGKRTPSERRNAEQELLPLLKKMTTQCPLPFEAVRSLDQIVTEQGLISLSENDKLGPGHLDKRLYFRERDDRAFCIVHPGRDEWLPTDGVNILVTHIDYSFLRAREQPTWFEWDPEKKFFHPGAYVEVMPYGGLHAPNWEGLNGHLRGRINPKHYREVTINVPAKITSSSFHLEIEDGHEGGFDRVRVFLGATSVEEQHRLLRVRTEDDLIAAEIYFFPDTRFVRLGTDFFSVYGLDDRACVSAAVHAALQASPRRPSFIFGLTDEEIGSTGSAGRTTGFFKRVINKYMTHRIGMGRRRSLLVTEQLYDMGVLGNYPALCGDVCPVMSYNEMQKRNLDMLEGARMGFGPFMTGSWMAEEGNIVSPRNMAIVKDALDTHLYTNAHRKYQMVGSDFKSEDATMYELSHFARHFTDDHVPTVVVGTPVMDLHRPTGETIFFWDWVETINAYKAYLEFKPRAPRRR